MKKRLFVWLALLLVASMMFAACSSATPSNNGDGNGSAGADAPKTDFSEEVYVWACQYNSLPLFVNNDYLGLDFAEKELGVTVKKIGPQEMDMPAMIAAIEQEIPKKPAGMMVVGWDSGLAQVINKVHDAGINVITIDADVPNCKRISFVGADTRDAGVQQAIQIAPYIKDKTGKIACFGVAGSEAHMMELEGFTTTLAKLAPGITVDPTLYPSESNPQKVAEKAKNMMQADPEIVGFGGFDSNSGPGIATAIKEAGKIGQVFGVCVDGEAEQLQGVKDGALVAAVGFKRQFNTYYGVKMLFDANHTPVQFTSDDSKYGITPIPSFVNIGYIIATKDNVEGLLAEKMK